MSILLELFHAFCTIGVFCFGGGFAVLSYLQQTIDQRGWMSTERFADLIAISQSTPGPIAINIATFVGYEQGGLLGALVASIAVALPGMVLITVLAHFFSHFYERVGVQAAFRGLRPVVVGMIGTAAWQIGKVSLINWHALAITGVSLVLIFKWKVNPIFLILGAAAAGILFL